MISNSFETARAAAIAGLQAAMVLARENGWEYGGYVFNNPDGSFRYSDIVTKKEPHSVSMEEALPADLVARLDAMQAAVEALPDDGKLDPALKAKGNQLDADIEALVVGTFHTHLTHEAFATELTRYFSGRDIFLAVRLEQFAWLGLTDTNEVFELDARTVESAKATAGTTRRSYPAGDSVGGLLALLAAHVADEAPFMVTGTRVYAGNVQDAQQKAA